MITTKTFKFITTIEVLVAGEIPDGEIVESICNSINTSDILVVSGDGMYAYAEDINMEWLTDEE
jgi:hypothetical protein